MRKLLLILLSAYSLTAYSQSQPTSAKTKFVNGIYLGTKLDAYFNAADSNAIYWRADSALMAKYKGAARRVVFSGELGSYLPISDTTAMLSGYKTYYPRTAISAGTGISYNAATGVITNSSPSSGGTVTSVSAGTGMSFTTITSSGAVNADTTTLATRAYAAGLDVGKANTSLNNVNGVLSSTYGGAGSVSGILKANGSGVVSAAVNNSDYTLLNGTGFVRMSGTTPSYLTGTSSQFVKADGSLDGTSYATTGSLSGYLPLSGGTLTGALSGTSASFSGRFAVGTTLSEMVSIVNTASSGYQAVRVDNTNNNSGGIVLFNSAANTATETGGFLRVHQAGTGASQVTAVFRQDGTGNILNLQGSGGGLVASISNTGTINGTSLSMSGGAEISHTELNSIFVTNPTTSGATTGSGVGFKSFNGTSVSQQAGIFLTSNTWSFGTYSANQLSVGSDGTGGLALRSANSAPITFFTGGASAGVSTEKGRFASDGTFLINTTTTDGTNKLIVNGGVKGGAATFDLNSSGTVLNLTRDGGTNGGLTVSFPSQQATFNSTVSDINFQTLGIERLKIAASTGAITASSSVTASSFVTTGSVRTTNPSDPTYYGLFSNDGAMVFDAYGAGTFSLFKVNGTAVLSVDASGAVISGTSRANGYIFAYAAKSSNYTLTGNDDYITVTNASTITLPTAVGRAGKRYVIRSTAGSGVTSTLATTSSQTVDGAAGPYSFGNGNYNILIVFSDGANWFSEQWITGS